MFIYSVHIILVKHQRDWLTEALLIFIGEGPILVDDGTATLHGDIAVKLLCELPTTLRKGTGSDYHSTNRVGTFNWSNPSVKLSSNVPVVKSTEHSTRKKRAAYIHNPSGDWDSLNIPYTINNASFCK